MAFKTVFNRFELKYLITAEQKLQLLYEIQQFICKDDYGESVVRNLYFDTDSYLLIRRSAEKPIYKEKLRLRSYCTASSNTTVFAEIKKKYRSQVYKRRIALPYEQAMNWLVNKKTAADTQIAREIDYFLSYYGTLHPTVFLSYRREAYRSVGNEELRITFDTQIFAQQDNLTLCSEPYGTNILAEEYCLMEIKCGGGIPAWLTEVLSRMGIYKTSFSKYGAAYKKLIFPTLKENMLYGKFI